MLIAASYGFQDQALVMDWAENRSWKEDRNGRQLLGLSSWLAFPDTLIYNSSIFAKGRDLTMRTAPNWHLTRQFVAALIC